MMEKTTEEQREPNHLITQCNFRYTAKNTQIRCKLSTSGSGTDMDDRESCVGEKKCVVYQQYVALLGKNAVVPEETYNKALDELNARLAELEEIKKEIASLQKQRTILKADNFLQSVISKELYTQLKTIGFIELKGTNEATYHITQKGEVDRYWLLFGYKVYHWSGYIQQNNSNIPLDDAIASVCMNILADSDRFDEEKKCGVISVNV